MRIYDTIKCLTNPGASTESNARVMLCLNLAAFGVYGVISEEYTNAALGILIGTAVGYGSAFTNYGRSTSIYDSFASRFSAQEHRAPALSQV